MFKPIALLLHQCRRRGSYALASLLIALSLALGSAIPATALSIGDILRGVMRGVEVIQLSNLSDRKEVQIGQQINDQLVRREVRLYRNPGINQYINDIGQRLASRSKRTNIPYTFQVVDDKSVNAFATMGGFVYINTGLIRAAENESELASVIGHEIGHITGRHAVKQMRDATLQQGAAELAGVDRNTIVRIGMDLALRRPHSRKHERDADQRGLRMLGEAGYAQIGMVSFMEKLQSRSPVPEFLSTHPSPANRVRDLEQGIISNPYPGSNGMDTNAYRSRIRPL